MQNCRQNFLMLQKGNTFLYTKERMMNVLICAYKFNFFCWLSINNEICNSIKSFKFCWIISIIYFDCHKLVFNQIFFCIKSINLKIIDIFFIYLFSKFELNFWLKKKVNSSCGTFWKFNIIYWKTFSTSTNIC